MKNHKGFTLIELLIVVAIIAILAAIAIPNFLAAQIRSRVSRVKADFRSIATAVESYSVDYNTYPMHRRTPWPGLMGTYYDNVFQIMTTPIAYITSIPKDPFQSTNEVLQGRGYYLFTWKTPGSSPYGPYGDFDSQRDKFTLRSPGPDSDWDTGPFSPPWSTNPGPGLWYDPSNGTVSNGDIWRYGGGVPFPNI